MSLNELKCASLAEIQTIYQKLKPAPLEMRQGIYQAHFIGPWWITKSAGPSLSLSGLAGWYGKRFIQNDKAINLLIHCGEKSEKLEMDCVDEMSLIDGAPTVALIYGEKAPIPWRWVIDEVRTYDDQTLLCMTIVKLPILRYFPFPFLLCRVS